MKMRSIPLSLPRRFIADLSETRLAVPLGVVRRTINIGRLRQTRRETPTVPWTILFAKAWALVASDIPALRQTYAKLPWPHLTEADASAATIMIERDWDGEKALFPAKLKRPAERALTDLAHELDRHVNGPVETNRHYAVIMRLTRLPLPIRRLAWWLAFNVGAWRVAYFGTFGISVLGHAGVMIDVPVSPLTSFVSYGPFQPNGDVEIIVAFDHRVMDGGLVAEAMSQLEQVLNTTIIAELQALGVTV
ncbi:MAG: acyltransferase [Bosea sp. (in: a-proteobacteria)]